MKKPNYFQEALSNFTFDVASGGAIRHLTDLGYTARQISQNLDFPTPYDRIQKTVWERLLDTGVILLAEPGNGKRREKFAYVRDYDQYGKASFRRVDLSDGDDSPVCWREQCFCEESHGDLAAYLAKQCGEEEKEAYASCDFGLRSKREPSRWEKVVQVLEEEQREYVLGIPWERRLVYHRLDRRMREILVCLYRHGEYEGICYFGRIGEKLRIMKNA